MRLNSRDTSGAWPCWKSASRLGSPVSCAMRSWISGSLTISSMPRFKADVPKPIPRSSRGANRSSGSEADSGRGWRQPIPPSRCAHPFIRTKNPKRLNCLADNRRNSRRDIRSNWCGSCFRPATWGRSCPQNHSYDAAIISTHDILETVEEMITEKCGCDSRKKGDAADPSVSKRISRNSSQRWLA